MTTQQPNIVLIMADQLAPQFTSSYGHPVVKTPHMDKLAQRGMRFDAAYCNAPLCAPSRFTFMSGQLVTRIAAYDNASEFLSSIPTFAHYLRGIWDIAPVCLVKCILLAQINSMVLMSASPLISTHLILHGHQIGSWQMNA
jgi:hypothetical protein